MLVRDCLPSLLGIMQAVIPPIRNPRTILKLCAIHTSMYGLLYGSTPERTDFVTSISVTHVATAKAMKKRALIRFQGIDHDVEAISSSRRW